MQCFASPSSLLRLFFCIVIIKPSRDRNFFSSGPLSPGVGLRSSYSRASPSLWAESFSGGKRIQSVNGGPSFNEMELFFLLVLRS